MHVAAPTAGYGLKFVVTDFGDVVPPRLIVGLFSQWTYTTARWAGDLWTY